ncbi:heme-binding protein [Morganella morganii]
MNNIYSEIISEIQLFCKNKCQGCCLSILDCKGSELLYISHGNPTPCSESLSKKKAFTAYSFMGNSDEIYSSFLSMGHQSLITDEYCFIPGGVFSANNGVNFFIGVSTDKESIDKELSLLVSQKFRGNI